MSLKDEAVVRLVKTPGFASRLQRKGRFIKLVRGEWVGIPCGEEAQPAPDETDSSSICCQTRGPPWVP